MTEWFPLEAFANLSEHLDVLRAVEAVVVAARLENGMAVEYRIYAGGQAERDRFLASAASETHLIQGTGCATLDDSRAFPSLGGGVGGDSPQTGDRDGPVVPAPGSPVASPRRGRMVSARLRDAILETTDTFPIFTLETLESDLGVRVSRDGLRHAVRVMRTEGDLVVWREPSFGGELWISGADLVGWIREQRNGDPDWSAVVKRVLGYQPDAPASVALVKILEAAGAEIQEVPA